MKNKSKLNKIRESKSASSNHLKESKSARSNIQKEWFYMNNKEITVRNIKEILDSIDNISIEIWDEAAVIEIQVGEFGTLEMEGTETSLGDPYSNDFLKRNNVASLYYVTIDADHYVEMKKIMEKIINTVGGFFCADTDNFMPVVGECRAN